MTELSKADKMRVIIRRELERSLIPGLQKQLNANLYYVKKLNAHPKFLDAMKEELVELQLPYYMMASDEVANAAYEFFMSPVGAQWCTICGEFNDKLMNIVPAFIHDVLIPRLHALEGN